jgi:hypothetical protein
VNLLAGTAARERSGRKEELCSWFVFFLWKENVRTSQNLSCEIGKEIRCTSK